ncbi:Hsp20/alpha crystallin family protein [Cellulophaga sp. HaHaR_3_176]|uniref:Hsp20/alpha crystallin family protein n=1 Tax=Cellulophaga sp. HaHaR_3_176 TaxID=1942464 RepID=UPI001C1FBF75|nr:Hsp20/alpha crystallin family protein [Cellulophaga sp. HaHaR_3_176]QWX82724.1 Hsp20/alpha crystallin family protein [Cellulophaga sp. HaHaR_3_176]
MSTVNKNLVSFPSFMNDLLKPDWLGGAEVLNNRMPAVNIKEDTSSYMLELNVPGRKKDDFKIEVDNDILTISSESKKEASEKNESNTEKYTRREFSFSSFKRAFTLPDTIDTEKIEAVYEDGILSFSLPKKEEALPKPKRLIALG